MCFRPKNDTPKPVVMYSRSKNEPFKPEVRYSRSKNKTIKPEVMYFRSKNDTLKPEIMHYRLKNEAFKPEVTCCGKFPIIQIARPATTRHYAWIYCYYRMYPEMIRTGFGVDNSFEAIGRGRLVVSRRSLDVRQCLATRIRRGFICSGSPRVKRLFAGVT